MKSAASALLCLAVLLSAPAILVAQGPTVIDDAAMLRDLSHQAGALIEAGRFTPAADLLNQLTPRACSLDLPAGQAEPVGEQLYDRCAPGVLVIASIYKCGNNCNDWHTKPASGFAITPDGTFVTNHHVIASAGRSGHTMMAMTSEGRVFPIKEIIAADQVNDIAIGRLDLGDQRLAPLSLRDDDPPVGSPVSVLSHPKMHLYMLTAGRVSRYSKAKRHAPRATMLNITADYAGGSSGGPVLDPLGRVVGMVRQTESIYYNDVEGDPRNLQMVIKLCVTGSSIYALCTGQAPPTPPKPHTRPADQPHTKPDAQPETRPAE